MVIGNQIADVLDNQVGIVIYDSNGQILMVFGGGHTDGGIIRANSTGTDNAISAVNDDGGYAGFFSDGGSGTNVAVHISIINSANTSSVLELSNAHIFNTHFNKMINLLGIGSTHIYISDGTTPNGALTGNKGDICLKSSATGQIAYCTADSSTNWTLI